MMVLAIAIMIMPLCMAKADTPTNHNNNATVTVSKTISATEDGIFPNITSFQFLLEPVGYTPGPTNSGAIAYSAANLPMPGNSTGAQAITITGFSPSAGGTTQTLTATTSNIPYIQTGVYTYRVTERIPGTTDALGTVPGSPVPGVVYDETVYYINVYVTNVLNDDGTPLLDEFGGAVVNVSAITVWETNNTPNLDPTQEDNGGVGPIDNNIGEQDDGKVDIIVPTDSDGDVRNINIPYENDYDTASLIVSKLVTGDMADVDLTFTFTLTLVSPAGGTDTASYTYQIYDMGDDRAVGGTDDTALAGANGTIANGGTFTLMHGQYIEIIGLPDGERVTTIESGSTDYKTTITVEHGNTANPAVLTTVKTGVTTNKTTNQQVIYTGEGAVNEQNFNNNKESVTPTGVILDILPYVLLVAVAGVLVVVLFKKRK
jgi:hypothetical protein